MILLTSEYCPFSQRCILALTEKGIDFQNRTVDLTRKTEFLEELSPYRRVPVLKHGDNTIYESSIINEYLEDIRPKPALLPADPMERAQARFWIDFCNTRFMPTYFNLLKSSDGASRNRLRGELLNHLAFMDEQGLSGHSYWMGGHIGLSPSIRNFQYFASISH